MLVNEWRNSHTHSALSQNRQRKACEILILWVKAWYFAGTERHGGTVLLRAVSWWFCKDLQFVKLQVKLTLLVNWNLYRSLNLQLRGNKICSVSFCISWKYFLSKCTCALSSTVFLPLLRTVFLTRSLKAKWYKPVSHCNIADLAKWLVWFYLPKSRPLKKKENQEGYLQVMV